MNNMWNCPQCGRMSVSKKCGFCGIEAVGDFETMQAIRRNCVGENNYYMVSNDFFRAKETNRHCKLGFICSLTVILSIAAVPLCLMGLLKLNREREKGLCLGFAGILISLAVLTAVGTTAGYFITYAVEADSTPSVYTYEGDDNYLDEYEKEYTDGYHDGYYGRSKESNGYSYNSPKGTILYSGYEMGYKVGSSDKKRGIALDDRIVLPVESKD